MSATSTDPGVTPGGIRSLELNDPSFLLLHEDVGESYDAVTRSAAEAVGAETCHIALYDTESDEMLARRPRYTASGRPVPQFRFRLDTSPASSRVVRTGEPYLSNDPANDPLYEPSVRERGVRSVLTVPIQRESRILGLLYALNKPGGFTPEDVRTLVALARAFAVTLENIRLYAEERDRRVLNESLWEMSRALVGSVSEDAALGAVLEQMSRAVRFQSAIAVVREGDRLRVAASRGGEAGLEIQLALAGELGEILEGRPTGVLSDAAARLPELGIRDSTGKALAAPLVAKEGVLGALVVIFEADHSLVRRDSQLVNAFADHAAFFLEAGTILRRERQARARAAAVARITRAAVRKLEPEPLLRAVAPEILDVSGGDRVALYLKHPQKDLLVPIAEAGAVPGEHMGFWELRLDLRSPHLAPLAERRPVAFDGESCPPPASITPFRDTQALLVIPLVARDEILGAVAVSCLRRAGHFDAAFVAFLKDVAQQLALGVGNARLFAALTEMASTDELTQLANRRKFTEALRLETGRSRRTGVSLALIMADVDHLKQINDTHGHQAGDAAIRNVADALQRGRRDTDLAARLGGEEFALLLPGTDRAGAVRAADRVRSELSDSSVPLVGFVTVSLGVAMCPEDGVGEEQLVRVADERLYTAKAAGRNRVCSSSLPDSRPSPGTTPAPGDQLE